MNKKIISAVLSAALFIGALYVPAIARDEKATPMGDKVTLIVETEGAPLLETKNAVLMGASEYMETDEAKETEARLLSAQAEVKSDIEKRVGADVNSGRTYTSVFNGFSVEAYESDIEKIKAVDGVKNVYKSVTFEVPDEPASNGESEPGYGAAMMNAQAMYDAGFDGRGKVIAIIDAAFDTSHEFFASGVEEPTLTKSKIREFIENNEFNVDISANQVYRSEKIPFAYDYCYGDADTYNALETHGNHVAGIAAGKNGVFEGTTFSGVAPEAQLVLMKVGYDSDDGSMAIDVVIDALDDASKLGVCAVNLSLGSTIAEYAPYDTAVENMRKAGIAVVCAAGNSDRYGETADNPDYIYNNVPASFSASTSVASIDPNKKWVFTGDFTLGGGERSSTPKYSRLFFEKFADKYYDYVCGYTLADFQTMGDIAGKIAVVPEGSDAKSGILLEMGVVGLIVVSADEEVVTIVTASDEIPGIMVSKTVGERLRSAETKTVKTDRTENRTIEEQASGMAYYTSWGTQSGLELKPEITAPGTDILSAGNDDEYINDSGTSMASPHITGAMALMSGLVDEKCPGVKGADKVALMENLLMSSADIVFRDEEKTLPESPRRQGAGLADLSDALTLPVILKGDTGKSKLSLRDRLDDNITLKFTAENLTGEDVTYDSIKIYAFTDDYEERDGKNMITGSVPLEFEPAADNPESVTIPANGEKEITLKITLDSEQTAANKEIFTNGFWVDGYIVLSSSDGSVTEASMPYTGFYGDWTAFDAMTPSYFEEGGSKENGGLMASDAVVLGTNKFVPDDAPDRSEYESEDYAGLSNSIDLEYNIEIRMLRSLCDVTTTVKNSNGDIIITEPAYMGLSRKEDYMDFVPIGAGDLPDGDYTVTVSGTLAYDSERSRTEEKTYKFYVDSIAPKIKNPKIYEEDGKTYASFEASDNRYLMGAAVHDANGKTVTAAVKAEKETAIKMDITGMDLESLEFSVVDYAYNENVFTVGTVSAEIMGSVIDGGNAAFIANVTNTAADADADVIMALYDGGGRLIGVNMQNVFLESGEKKIFTFDFADVPEIADVKLFVWEHGKMTPLGMTAIATYE